MNLQVVFFFFLARVRTILFVAASVVALTVIACLVLPPRYSATASVVLDTKADPVSSVMAQAGVVSAINLSTATEVEIITSDRVARRVVALLKLDQDPENRALWLEDTEGKGRIDVWLADKIKKKLTVKQVSLQSNVLPIKFEARDPEYAAAVANAFAQAYIEVNVERKVEPARQYAKWFSGQEKAARDALEAAQRKLSTFQQDKGVVAKDEQTDSETAKLTELTQQLSTVQGQTAEALSKQNSGRAAESLPDISQHPLITGLKTDLARAEGKLQDVGGNLGKNHPQYKRMEAEIEALKERLQTEIRNITTGFSTSRKVALNKESELRAAIEEQKRKLLATKSIRDELAVLQRDVEAKKKTLDGISNQLQQSLLDSQSNQTNVTVLTPAVAPIEPSFPKLILFTLISIPAGLVLGAAVAYALEMKERPVRSAEDLAETLRVPVLGIVERLPAVELLRLPLHRRLLYEFRRARASG